LNYLPIFKETIAYLAPGNVLRFDIKYIKNEDIEIDYKVKILYSYKNDVEETIKDEIIIDLRYIGSEEF
jgi:hypothetical protein